MRITVLREEPDRYRTLGVHSNIEDVIKLYASEPNIEVSVEGWRGTDYLLFNYKSLNEFLSKVHYDMGLQPVEKPSDDFYDQMIDKYTEEVSPIGKLIRSRLAEETNMAKQEEPNHFLAQDNNPKTIEGNKKASTHHVPPVAFFACGAAMKDGAQKYGPYNWRETSVTASVFYDAMMRHLADWWDRQDYAPDSKVHHLGHLMASCAIILDAIDQGVFIDDRPEHSRAAGIDKDYAISRSELWIGK